MQELKPYFHYLIDCFQGVNRLFVLPFKSTTDRIVHAKYFLQTVEIEYYNVITNEQNFFDQPVKNKLKRYDNIQKIATAQGDDYTTSCLLDYNYFDK